ncbi:hypothetical protein D9613_009124 [Agrocybe pediades]|uniref:HRDC domain-containing protein n=1 Tax=Agrocybe pediades TaxID=84607 RepID=A0A8H4R2U7_9AGAR|nr:hypothetical protein D9613_009124 [Agrocybe pediades]
MSFTGGSSLSKLSMSLASCGVLLVEKTIFEADLSDICKDEVNQTAKKGVRKSTAYPKAPKGHAIKHGVQRGAHHGKSDENLARIPVPLDSMSPDEGLYTLAQTGHCRRKVLTEIYGNKPAQPTVPCCDICDPSLLDRTRPSAPEPVPRKVAVKTGEVNVKVKIALQKWRREIWKRDFEDALFGPSVIIKDETLTTLASVGPIERLNELEKATGGDWPWFGKYGDELLDTMKQLDIAPVQAKPQRRTEKRPLAGVDGNEVHVEEEGGSLRKKRATTQSTTPVIPNPVVTPLHPASASRHQHQNFTFVPHTPRTHPGSQAPSYSSHATPPILPYTPLPYYHTPYPPYMYPPYFQYPVQPFPQQVTPSRTPAPSTSQCPDPESNTASHARFE